MQVVVALLVVRRRGELGHADVTRVERRDEALDRAALAARVPALEEHAQRRPEPARADEPAERQPHLGQPQPQFGPAAVPTRRART
jgi:hypothetical protein